ncbi:hypothetical protein GPJ56_004169 [Histomonas meleagridis]|uniref:uncharacterized protein n=1 Tax=Histomonas meleagridis TaxID=135588 RepID=UPI00355A3C28|nr:hypothetical protein GPJ56_004169 [Histomonas meleagridis]KAH0801510.1 hypothetical protein GO595_005762 [Histomonas meleagridis]
MIWRAQDNSSTTEENKKTIPREFKISNPMPAITPNTLPPSDEFPIQEYQAFKDLIVDFLPTYTVDLNMVDFPILDQVKAFFENSESTMPIGEFIMESILLQLQHNFVKAMPTSSLTRLSVLHHQLYQILQILEANKLNTDLIDFCDMMLEEVADTYHSNVCDVIEQRFWSKTKSPEELIKCFLKKEVERLRLLNDKTYQILVSHMLRKAVDSAPHAGAEVIIRWMKKNGLQID